MTKEELKQYIEEHGFSRRQICNGLNITQRQLTNYLNGTTPITNKIKFAIIHLVECLKGKTNECK
tara:strand:- start:18428 stop:18622 length:195 start_codon:yes stop_codon:yes gene_type:complete